MSNASTFSVHARQEHHNHFVGLADMKRGVILQRIPWLFASIYEKATRMVIKSYYNPLAAQIVSHLRSGFILDLGTGPGYLPIEIAKQSSSIKVHGMDLGRKLISVAKSNASRAGVDDRVSFEAGNAANLPLNDDLCDMVLSTGMLHCLKDPVRVLREIHRVLRPGCEAWIYDPAQVSSQIDFEAWKASMTLVEKFAYRIFLLFTKVNPPQVYNREQVEAMISKTDFVDFRIDERDGEMKITLTKQHALKA